MTGVPTEALEAAARAAVLAATSTVTGHTVGCICARCEDLAAAGPVLIAEGRRRAAQEIIDAVWVEARIDHLATWIPVSEVEGLAARIMLASR